MPFNWSEQNYRKGYILILFRYIFSQYKRGPSHLHLCLYVHVCSSAQFHVCVCVCLLLSGNLWVKRGKKKKNESRKSPALGQHPRQHWLCSSGSSTKTIRKTNSNKPSGLCFQIDLNACKHKLAEIIIKNKKKGATEF